MFNYAEEKQFTVYRLTFSTFEAALVKFGRLVDENPTTIGYPRMSSDKELMITLWYLGNAECFRLVMKLLLIHETIKWQCS